MKRALAIVFASTLACASLAAQTAEKIPPRDNGGAIVKPSPTTDAMKAALRTLVTYEEKYWSSHGTYTTDGSALGIYPAKNGQASVQVIFAGSRGWTGIATDRAWKGKSCVIYAGDPQELPGGVPKTSGGVVTKHEGEPICDAP